MALEVHYSTALAVYHEPSNGTVATTGTAVLREPDGTTLETLSVTLPPPSTPLSSVTDNATLVVARASGITVGHKYQIVSDGVTYIVTVARVDGTSIHLAAAMPDQPDTSSTFKAIRMTASIAAPGVAKVGSNYRLEWLFDDGTTEGFGSDVVHVVRWKWNAPITGTAVLQYVARQFPSLSRKRSQWYFDDVARRANNRIRDTVQAVNRRPHLYGSPNVFEAAGLEAARLELAKDGVLPAGLNASLFENDRADALADAMNRAISSLAMYDRDGDGKIDSTEARGFFFTVSARR